MAKSRISNPLTWAAITLVALWLIPFGGLLLLPLQYLNTHIHELGHALAALISGGQGMRIEVYPDGSGITSFRGGWTAVVAPAGYVGATAVGTALLAAGRTEKGARLALSLLGVFLTIGLILWVRNPLGFGTGILYAALCFAGRALKGDNLRFATQLVGLHQVVASIQALLVLVNVNTYGHEHNDALILAQATGIPALFWAISWVVISAVIVFYGIRGRPNRTAANRRSS